MANNNGLYSQYVNISTDVPYGSVRCIYYVFMYADDTILSCNLSDMSMNDQSVTLNNEFEKINNWLSCDKLPLKSHFSQSYY